MADFKKGDTVSVKSGGPRMTVEAIGNFGRPYPEDGVKCVWFVGTRQERDVFGSAVLQIDDDDGSFQAVKVQRS